MEEPKNIELLEKFMKEFFDIESLEKVGFFTNEMRGDYKAYAKRVCDYFGLKTVYEYRAREIKAHISYTDGKRPENEPFVTILPNIYE